MVGSTLSRHMLFEPAALAQAAVPASTGNAVDA